VRFHNERRVLKRLAGGDLVRVAVPHAIRDCLGEPANELRGRPATDWTYCRAGDLAVEVLSVRGGDLVGHIYFSGPATGMLRKSPARQDWFSPASLIGTSFSPTEDGESDADCMERTVRKMMPMKYGGGGDVYVFCVGASNAEQAKLCMNFIATCWTFVPESVETPPSSHLVGIISVGGSDRRGIPKFKSGSIVMQIQPPHDAGEQRIDSIQAFLLWDAACREAVAKKTNSVDL